MKFEEQLHFIQIKTYILAQRITSFKNSITLFQPKNTREKFGQYVAEISTHKLNLNKLHFFELKYK